MMALIRAVSASPGPVGATGAECREFPVEDLDHKFERYFGGEGENPATRETDGEKETRVEFPHDVESADCMVDESEAIGRREVLPCRGGWEEHDEKSAAKPPPPFESWLEEPPNWLEDC
jgi:hypothetical protein